MNLFKVIESGNLDKVKAAVNVKNIDFKKNITERANKQDKKGDTILHIASEKGYIDIVDYLLFDLNADAKIKNKKGEIPLHKAAAKENNTAILESLVDYDNTTLDFEDNDKNTALYIASENGDSDMVASLLENEAKPNTKNNKNETALHVAKNKEIAEILLKNKADVTNKDNAGSTPLHFAAQNNNIETAKVFAKYKKEVNALDDNKDTPLHLASEKEIIEILLNNGAKVNNKNNKGHTPLHYVVEDHEVEDYEVEDHDEVVESERENNFEIAEMILKHGGDINAVTNNGYTPLYLAIDDDKEDMALFLLDKGANPNIKTNGSTPLHNTSANNLPKLSIALIIRGADVNAKDDNGSTPLHSAIKGKNTECLQILLENRGDLSIANNEGETPRDLIIQSNNPEMLEILSNYDKHKIEEEKFNTPLNEQKKRKAEPKNTLSDNTTQNNPKKTKK